MAKNENGKKSNKGSYLDKMKAKRGGVARKKLELENYVVTQSKQNQFHSQKIEMLERMVADVYLLMRSALELLNTKNVFTPEEFVAMRNELLKEVIDKQKEEEAKNAVVKEEPKTEETSGADPEQKTEGELCQEV